MKTMADVACLREAAQTVALDLRGTRKARREGGRAAERGQSCARRYKNLIEIIDGNVS